MKSKLSGLIDIIEKGNVGRYYNEYAELKRRTDELEIFFYNFTIFAKKILSKDINEIDSSIFSDLESVYYSNLRDSRSFHQNCLTIKEHHQILDSLNLKVNELKEQNKNLKYY